MEIGSYREDNKSAFCLFSLASNPPSFLLHCGQRSLEQSANGSQHEAGTLNVLSSLPMRLGKSWQQHLSGAAHSTVIRSTDHRSDHRSDQYCVLYFQFHCFCFSMSIKLQKELHFLFQNSDIKRTALRLYLIWVHIFLIKCQHHEGRRENI